MAGCQNPTKQHTSSSGVYFDTVFFLAENKYEVSTMCGIEKHGVTKIYHTKYGEIGERFYVHNKLMITRELGGDSLTAGYTYFYNLNDTLLPIGSIIYNRDDFQKLDIMCTYFQIEASDSVTIGQPYKVKIIGNIGLKKGFKVSLTIGELDTNYKLINVKDTYTSEGKILELQISDYKNGINTLTGILRYLENGEDITKKYRISEVDLPLVFYKQFVAISP
jgi:hypothetical protein